ncbi:MAG: M28 family peptidase [Chloroherpetonaceae bacterium]|nr:M28 family peptidase [Chloroherpetonaceae bacterium]
MPEFLLSSQETAAHIRFLASDELMGRMTGEIGNNVAARYIAEQFRLYGLKEVQGAAGYYQKVPLVKVRPPKDAFLVWGTDTLRQGKDLLVLNGSKLTVTAPVVFAKHGIVDDKAGRNDYEGIDAKGKIVVVKLGDADNTDVRQALRLRETKQKAAAERGAMALLELYDATVPWSLIMQFANRETIQLPSEETAHLTYIWLSDAGKTYLERALRTESLTIESSGLQREPFFSQNVIGLIEGSDPTLRNEYILLSAHYDHIGTGRRPNQTDTIFNGARDNGMGTTALLAAAKAFSQKPPKRSVICLAVTAEEVGLLGSQYYATHPLVPLEQTVFNLNVDGAGYNDTTIVTVIGWERTTAMKDIEAGAKAFGLGIISDPAPEQNLFNRSDNVSFAAKGVPAPTFSEGFRSFNAEIGKYYHQPADQADENFNFSYLHRFCQAYIHAARRIADRPERPRWVKGDKYEPAFNLLYGKR